MEPTLVTEVSQLVQGHLWAVGFVALASATATLLGVRLFLLRPTVVRMNAMAASLAAREQELRAADERFRRIAGTITEVFWIADVDLRTMRYVSPAYEHIWGRSCESLYRDPRSFLRAIHPEDFQRVSADLKAQHTGQPFDHEYRVIRPDGSIRWIWDRGFPVPGEHGRVVEYIGIAQDVTERVQREASHRDVEEHLRFALEAAHVGVWESDLVTGAAFWSATCEVMHGLAPGTFGKTFEAFVDRVDPDDRPRVREQIQQAIRERRETHVEYQTTWPDGSRHWIVASAHFFYDDRGIPARGAGITVDVTERHALEEQLKHAQGQRAGG